MKKFLLGYDYVPRAVTFHAPRSDNEDQAANSHQYPPVDEENSRVKSVNLEQGGRMAYRAVETAIEIFMAQDRTPTIFPTIK